MYSLRFLFLYWLEDHYMEEWGVGVVYVEEWGVGVVYVEESVVHMGGGCFGGGCRSVCGGVGAHVWCAAYRMFIQLTVSIQIHIPYHNLILSN